MDRGFLNPIRNDSDGLCLLTCGIKQNKPGELCGPMIRGSYLLHAILQGHGRYTANNREYALKPGDVFAIFPEELVSYQADDEEPWLFCWIGFVGQQAPALYERLHIDPEHLVFQISPNDFLDAIRQCLDYYALHEENPSQLQLTAFAYAALSALERPGVGEKASKEQLYVQKSCAYMKQYYHRYIFASDVANYVGLEYSYFYRLFKKNAGISPEQYLIQLRIQYAKKYIQASVPLKEIPHLIGIRDESYFYRLFKKIVGMTPSDYRKRLCSDS